MKKIKNIMLLSLLAVVLSTTSCSDFLNVNSDPNRVTDANVTPDLIFTQAENAVGTRQANRFVFLNNWMGYMGRSGTFIVDQMETTYQIDNSFTETNWDQAYDILFDLYQTQTKAIAAKDSVLAGASIVLSVKLWQETVDQFGSIPYKQAFNYTKYPQPAYDKAADIYTDLLAQLDQAVKYLNPVVPNSSFANTDIIFARGGDLTSAVAKWNRFANTIRLRILLRQSAVLGSTPTAEIAKITANGGLLGVGDNVSVNPGYVDATNKQNPFYGAFGLTPAGAPATSDNTANNYFVTLLGSSDPRITQFYLAPIAGTDYGAQNGSISGTVVVGSGFGPGLLGTATSDQFIMPDFESLFFQAEAIARGWLPGGDAGAKSAFESGIKESFNFLQVPGDTTSVHYMKTIAVANWANSGTSVTEKVNFIAFQKYISLCGIDAVESWSDLRRGVLVLPAGYMSNNPTAAKTLPNVLTYPQSEFTTNSVHIPTPLRNTTSIFTEKLFWQP
jgi:hypothetical protein